MQFRNLKLLAIAALFICCTQQPKILTEVCNLPDKLKEASAVEITPKSNRIWILEDSGNKEKLYALDRQGTIVHTVKIGNAPNIDWEELTSDSDGNLYIGDFGNNRNIRRDLCIYKIRAENLDKEETDFSEKTSFNYPEQKDFPPKNSEMFYDAEAFFYHKGNFYLFTKNRGGGSNTSLYQIPALPGNQTAKFLGTFATCDSFKNCAITSADISDNGKKMVLLSNKKIWLFEKFKGDDFFHGKVREIDLNNNSQLEGVCFNGKSKLYFVDEKDKGTGGKLYEMALKN
jgi:hypothetical protein